METRRFPTGERRVFARACAKASTGTRTPCFGGENVVESDAMNTTTLTFEQRYVQARRRFIAADFANLNDMQRQAVLATEGPLLLLAGAGSGKTTVLIHRIANLIQYGRGADTDEVPEWATEEDLALLERTDLTPDERRRARRAAAFEPVEPWRIIAITFTNKAADELKERIERMLGPEAAADIWASTFHSACVRILRRDADKLGYPNSFTIYDTSDSLAVVKRIIKEMNLDDKAFPNRAVLTEISRAKDAGITPEQYLARAQATHNPRNIRIGEIYQTYWQRLFSAGAMDFDDLIYNTVRLLDEHADVREHWQRRFRYVLIDEYQDTNRLQYLLMKQLVGEKGNICVVGDDDQSIYKFRGADITNILNFEKEYKGCRTIRLEQNYRSTQNILDAANAVIKNNTGRKGKTLWTDAGAGDRVLIKTVFNEQDEANFVVSSIMMDYNRGRNWKENAILYRMNAQSNALEYAFKRNGVPYQVVGGTKFFERAEVKDMLAYLAVINNPSDDLRLRRIINNPPRGIGNTTIERVQDLASEQGVPMMAVLQHAGEYAVLKSAAGKLERFAALIGTLREAAETTELAEFYELVCEQTSYVSALREKGDMESRGRLENVQELKSNIVSFLENDPEDATLSGFLNEIALYTDLDSATSDNCVTMMTMHSAKGLEFPCVYVVGVEEGIFPGERVRYNDEEVEEERRLCYVAMTRAKERLTMTCTRQRMLFGRTSVSEPSRFLEEVPSENADWVGRQAQGASGFGDTSFDEGSSYSTRGYGSYGQGAARYDSVMQRRPKSQASQKLAAQKPAASAPLLQLASGDQIHHKTFGDGLVISVTPMGGDALLEVAFDTVGTKKLMLKTAGVHITKL